MTEHDCCTICGGKKLKPRFTVNGFRIVKCDDCSFQFVKENLTQEELGTYYRRSVVDNDYAYNSPENVENLNYYFNRLRGMIESSAAPGRILDVGCNGGYFLDVMGRWERYGIDIPSAGAEIAQKKYGKNIHMGTLADCPFADAFFDVISLQDSFDHMNAPMDALRKCHALLKPGGMIIVKVHDISSLYARLMGAHYYAVIPPIHLSYFSPKSLSLALSRAGFKVDRNVYAAHVLSLNTIFFRLARCETDTIYYRIFKLIERSAVGRLRIRKNLFDIMTMFARKL